MSNNGFTKTYDASGAIPAYTIVKFTATDFQVTAAAAATDKMCGVTTEVAAADTERCDVIHEGCAYVKAGGTIAAGDLLTSDASGNAITTTTASNRIIGQARQSAVAGDVFEALLSMGSV